MSYTGPYTNFHEINLNLFIRALKKLKSGIGGQSLVKKSNVEYDYEWKTLTAQDVGALPDSYTAPVDSVNGKTGAVVLDAQDVGALPDSYTAPVDSVNGEIGVVVLDAQDVGALPNTTIYKRTLLWENSEPTQNFIAKTIGLDLSNFSAVSIMIYRATNVTYGTTQECPVGHATVLFARAATAVTTNARRVDVYTDRVVFLSGYAGTTPDDSAAIPVKIWGIP